MLGGARVGCFAAVVGVWLSVAVAAASAAPPASVTMYSERGDWIGGGGKLVYTPANADIFVEGTNAELEVWVFDRVNEFWSLLRFAAPRGEVLASGVFDNAERFSFRTDGHPGLDVMQSRYACNDVDGRFEVKELHVTPQGVLQRLWVVYEHHCKDEPPAMFGEVRIGAVGSAVAVAPATVRWPITDRGRPAESVPVVLTAPDDLRVTGVALAGSGTGAFVVERDECSGRSLVAGAVCYVWVDYDTGQAGTRAAALRISDSAGRVHETNLEGFAYGGRTRMVADLPRPDPFNDALHWSYGPDEALIVAVGTPQELHFAVRPGDEVQEWWGAVFAPEPGGVLTVGRTYTGASPAWDARPRLYIEGDDRCESAAIGSFTVRELAFAPDGRVRRASVELARNCPTPSSPSRRFTGVFEVRAGDTTAEPPWTGPFSPGATGPVRPLTPVEPTPAPTDPPVEPPTDPPPPAEPETPAPLPGAPPAVSVSPAPTGERGANAKGDASRRRTLLVDRRSRLRLRVACRTRPCTGIVRVRWRGQVVAARRFSSRARRPRVVLRLDRGLTRRVRAGHAPHVTVVVRVERSPVLRIRAQLRPRR